jgi:hypothetical protein
MLDVQKVAGPNPVRLTYCEKVFPKLIQDSLNTLSASHRTRYLEKEMLVSEKVAAYLLWI